ncbi:MAG: hypothetical protein MI748_11345 [Opitutales bacterium]|nr:hypothetical protein [Opitutales bacterium]
MSFEKNVFINCPFDDNYWDLFRPLVFTILRLGCNPRYALERSDSSEARIAKIIQIIKKCKYGIHDLSRCKAKKKGELFRLNMPLELGLDLGAKNYGTPKLTTKKILIVEEERYRFQAAISDISNSDIKDHRGDPRRISKIVRDWLVQEADVIPLAPIKIWYQFTDCLAQIYDDLRQEGYSKEDIDEFPEHELIQRMTQWVRNKSWEDLS